MIMNIIKVDGMAIASPAFWTKNPLNSLYSRIKFEFSIIISAAIDEIKGKKSQNAIWLHT